MSDVEKPRLKRKSCLFQWAYVPNSADYNRRKCLHRRCAHYYAHAVLLGFRNPGGPMYVIGYDFRVFFVQFGSQTSDAGYFDISARFVGTSYSHVRNGVDGRNAILEQKTDAAHKVIAVRRKLNERFLFPRNSSLFTERKFAVNTIDARAEKIVDYIVIFLIFFSRVNRLRSSLLDR